MEAEVSRKKWCCRTNKR